MTHDERVHELLYSTEDRAELCERMVELEEICIGMITDYMCCADDNGVLCLALHGDGNTFYRPEHMTVLERICDTTDGLKIVRYLDRLRELEVPDA